MPALLVNIKIDHQEKLGLFKVTLADLRGLFDECHVKIRGALAPECIEYAKLQFEGAATFYQELQEADWVAATLVMLAQVKSRSVFLFFEDHKLVAPRQHLKQTLSEFDECQLDYLCYSFFRASQLDSTNLLPLGGRKKNTFHEFHLNRPNIELLSKISPRYYTFSLTSITSVGYFRKLLVSSNSKYKIYSNVMTGVLGRLFVYPGYRRVVHRLNRILHPFGLALCIYPAASPFNLEKIWFESVELNPVGWKFGVPTQELLANYDDDNGAHGESLIKRGKYPINLKSNIFKNEINVGYCEIKISIKSGEIYDCTFISRKPRINYVPQVQIKLISGKVTVHYQENLYNLTQNEPQLFYSNLSPIMKCIEAGEVELKIYDEIFT